MIDLFKTNGSSPPRRIIAILAALFSLLFLVALPAQAQMPETTATVLSSRVVPGDHCNNLSSTCEAKVEIDVELDHASEYQATYWCWADNPHCFVLSPGDYRARLLDDAIGIDTGRKADGHIQIGVYYLLTGEK